MTEIGCVMKMDIIKDMDEVVIQSLATASSNFTPHNRFTYIYKGQTSYLFKISTNSSITKYCSVCLIIDMYTIHTMNMMYIHTKAEVRI